MPDIEPKTSWLARRREKQRLKRTGDSSEKHEPRYTNQGRELAAKDEAPKTTHSYLRSPRTRLPGGKALPAALKAFQRARVHRARDESNGANALLTNGMEPPVISRHNGLG